VAISNKSNYNTTNNSINVVQPQSMRDSRYASRCQCLASSNYYWPHWYLPPSPH
jgi:hypothetical protein